MGLVAAKCTQCGANIQVDRTKEAGICPNCGTAFVTEKVINHYSTTNNFENTFNIENAVFDTDEERAKKHIINARRALNKEDWEEVEKYYNFIERAIPNNIEAVFFSAYGKAMLSMTDNDYYKRQQKFKVLGKSISVINDYYETTTEDKEEILTMISNYIKKMFEVTFVYNSQSATIAGGINALSGSVGTKKWCESLLKETEKSFVVELKQILEKHDDEYLKTLLSKHEAPANSGGCYVATCVYGSYDCPEVWTLRRYRDNNLAKTWYGRAFIHTYYAISPTLVKWFGKTKWFQKMWKGKLDNMVKSLQDKGVECTPYEDVIW